MVNPRKLCPPSQALVRQGVNASQEDNGWIPSATFPGEYVGCTNIEPNFLNLFEKGFFYPNTLIPVLKL